MACIRLMKRGRVRVFARRFRTMGTVLYHTDRH